MRAVDPEYHVVTCCYCKREQVVNVVPGHVNCINCKREFRTMFDDRRSGSGEVQLSKEAVNFYKRKR